MGVKFCIINSSRINHFGKNPVRGGSPPRDRRVSMARAVVVGEVVGDVAISLMFFELSKIRV